jgi:hypothetical protein
MIKSKIEHPSFQETGTLEQIVGVWKDNLQDI